METVSNTDEVIRHDEDGKPYVLDENGNKRPPLRSAKEPSSSGFTTYDTSQGHCGLCGSISCRGSCFR